jgi:putative copper export protein
MTPDLAGLTLAGCRWLLYAAVLAVVGAAGARFVTDRIGSEMFANSRRPVDRLALIASVVWLLALAVTFAAQVISWFGPRALGDYTLMHGMLVRTRWGEAWMIAFGSAVAAVGTAGVMSWRGSRPVVALLAPAGAILTTPLLGHAAGRGSVVWILHGTHLLGTGMWLGTLLMLALATWAHWRDDSPSPALLRRMLESFTPVALCGAALTVATGMLIAAEHVWPVGRFLQSAYGLTLMVKIAMVAVIGVLGWINWRRLRPAADLPRERRQLRSAVIAELATGFGLVLAVTAWLSGLEMPM